MQLEKTSAIRASGTFEVNAFVFIVLLILRGFMEWASTSM